MLGLVCALMQINEARGWPVVLWLEGYCTSASIQHFHVFFFYYLMYTTLCHWVRICKPHTTASHEPSPLTTVHFTVLSQQVSDADLTFSFYKCCFFSLIFYSVSSQSRNRLWWTHDPLWPLPSASETTQALADRGRLYMCSSGRLCLCVISSAHL